MQIGITGLGRMGANMSLRLLDHGHRPVVFDRSPGTVDELVRGDGCVREGPRRRHDRRSHALRTEDYVEEAWRIVDRS